jgi:hypothetical protein
MNKSQRKYFVKGKYQSGATLIVIIVAMLVVAIIGTALYSITGTSTINQSLAQASAKAYYLAESGVRVAGSEFRFVPQFVAGLDNYVARNNKLVSLQGLVFPLPNNQGQFSIDVCPDWVYTSTAVTAGPSMTLYFPGSVRSGLTFPAGGILKRKGYTTIAFFNSAPVIGGFSAPNGTPIKFAFAAAYPYTFNANDEGYIGYAYNSPQTVNAGGNLVLDNSGGKAAIFPPTNGTIYIEHIATYPAPPNGSGISYTVMSQYTYDTRTIGATTVTLTNIQAVSGTQAAFPLLIVWGGNVDNITLTSRIYLGKTLTIQSTSTYGN